MNLLVEMGSSLLSFAHSIFQPTFCPGDWVWASIMAGFLVGLLPALGTVLIAVVRKGTANTYNAVTLTVFGVIGGVFAFLLPWLYAMGSSETFRTVFYNSETGGTLSTNTGLTANEVTTLGQKFCEYDTNQAYFLGGRPTVYDVLTDPFESPLMVALRYLMLIGLPAIAVLFVWLQVRLAFRRGPKWPGRLFWLPFVAMFLLTVGMAVNVATYMWIGLLLASVLGMLPLLVVGPPSWSTIERRQKAQALAEQKQHRPNNSHHQRDRCLRHSRCPRRTSRSRRPTCRRRSRRRTCHPASPAGPRRRPRWHPRCPEPGRGWPPTPGHCRSARRSRRLRSSRRVAGSRSSSSSAPAGSARSGWRRTRSSTALSR